MAEEVITNQPAAEVNTNPFETEDASTQQALPSIEKVVEVKETPTTKEVTVEMPASAKETPAPAKEAAPVRHKFLDYIAEGKEDDVLNYLQERKTLETVDKLSPEDQIKLNFKYKHSDYSKEEIEDLFNETYVKPEKPEQADDELDEEFRVRTEKWEKKEKAYQNKITREGKSAARELVAKKTELALPEIQKAQADVPPTPEELKERDNQAKAYNQTLEKGLSEFNGFSMTLKDGEVEVPVNYTIPEDEKKQFGEQLKTFNVVDYLTPLWQNADGSANGAKIAEDVYWLMNRPKILQKVASEAASQRLAAHIKEQKNIDYSGGRQANGLENASLEDERAKFFFGRQ